MNETTKKRSNEANYYCWKLCGDIANVVNASKEEVYRKIIKYTGIYEVIPVRDTAIERFISEWDSKGVGNICEVQGKSKLSGYTNLKVYFGTSSYSTKEMSKFIDLLRKYAESVGIEVLTLEEIMNLNRR